MSNNTTLKNNLLGDNKTPTNKSDFENRKRRCNHFILNQEYVPSKALKQDDDEDFFSVFGYPDEDIYVPEVYDDDFPERSDSDLSMCSVLERVKDYEDCHAECGGRSGGESDSEKDDKSPTSSPGKQINP